LATLQRRKNARKRRAPRKKYTYKPKAKKIYNKGKIVADKKKSRNKQIHKHLRRKKERNMGKKETRRRII
jgi:hypothetical protein